MEGVLPRRRESDVRPILLKGGRVIDPAANLDETTDVLIAEGCIASVGRGLDAPDGAEILDASGLVVAPGLIDVHVHFREPGGEVTAHAARMTG